MRRSMGVALAVAALGGSVLTGCGGDKPLSKAEFIKQGNAICAKGAKKIETAAKKAFSTKSQPTKQQIADFAEDEAFPAVETELFDLRDLTPPKGDKDKVEKLLDTAEAALKKAKDDPSTITARDPFDETNKLFSDYGLKTCAQ